MEKIKKFVENNTMFVIVWMGWLAVIIYAWYYWLQYKEQIGL